mmetsp:Transcript_12469/g.26877  ORF Transcript_12469/g.26877 Transcript_12469/m.26877 type:complete len:110 (+) Transcript_12469:1307-1636(+)
MQPRKAGVVRRICDVKVWIPGFLYHFSASVPEYCPLLLNGLTCLSTARCLQRQASFAEKTVQPARNGWSFGENGVRHWRRDFQSEVLCRRDGFLSYQLVVGSVCILGCS